MAHTVYFIISALTFFGISLCWSKKNLLEIIVKLAFFAAGLYGVFLTLTSLGFIIKR